MTLLPARHSSVVRRLLQMEDDDIAVTIITVIEIMRGRYDFLMKAATKTQFLHAQGLMRFSATSLEDLPTLFLDEIALDHFDELQKRKGLKRIGRADLLIASITLSFRATLVTRNLKHFKLIPQLKCENWVD